MRRLYLFLLLVGFGSATEAQTNHFESEFLQILQDYDAENNSQGITASISLDEFGEWQGVSGFSYGEVPMGTNLLVGVASNTKLFTSVLALKLIEDGFFSLDDPLSKWLDPIIFVDRSITVKQLLQHHSGLNDFINNSELFPGLVLSDPQRIWTPEETLEYLYEPIAQPAEGVYYSNANYVLAAMVIESATGMTYSSLLRDSIITPLGLQDIYLEGFEEIIGEVAHPFLLGSDYSLHPRIALGTVTWSAGALVTKPKTLTDWYDIIFKSDYLSDFVKSELTDFIEWPDDPDGKEMGLGIYRLNINGRSYYGHGGTTIGYSSYTLFDIACGHSISVVINELFSRPLELAVLLAEKACELTGVQTSTDEISQVNVAVYPNPANEIIHIPYATEFSLLQLDGSALRSVRNETMNIHDIENGVYLVKGATSEGSFVQKIVIQH